MNSWQWLIAAALVATLGCTASSERETPTQAKIRRKARLFNVLQVIRFENDACDASGSRNGTCFTAAECEDRDGTDGGSCADGFGVCCVFDISCGERSSENCTYFEETGPSDGPCRAEVCPCGNDICQMRLDFETFVITGPSTLSTSVYNLLNGQVVNTGGDQVGLASRCLTDTFSVTANDGGVGPPTICGVNTGEHMYVDSSEDCNELVFNFGAGTSTTRNFKIKVTQYACDSPLLAPQGCTQYFYGSSTGTVQAYNYNAGSGYHLANQHQTMCFRREQGNCRICFANTVVTDLSVGHNSNQAGNLDNSMSKCCRYGLAGASAQFGDCLQIPGNRLNDGQPKANRFCGRGVLLTRCTSTYPLQLIFQTDGYEAAGTDTDESDNNAPSNNGFRFVYWQDSQSCTNVVAG